MTKTIEVPKRRTRQVGKGDEVTRGFTSSDIMAAALGAIVLMGCRRGEPAEIGGTQGASGKELPAQQASCGKVLCALGEVCCNPSCGICTAPQGMCTQQFCDEAPAEAKAGEPPPSAEPLTCEDVHCQTGMHCEMVDVQCVRAPCEPVPQCRPDEPLEKLKKRK